MLAAKRSHWPGLDPSLVTGCVESFGFIYTWSGLPPQYTPCHCIFVSLFSILSGFLYFWPLASSHSGFSVTKQRPRPAVERGVLVRVTRISGTNSPARWFSKTWDKTRPGVRHLTRVFVARGVLCQGRVGEPQSCWQPDSFGQGWICSVDC